MSTSVLPGCECRLLKQRPQSHGRAQPQATPVRVAARFGSTHLVAQGAPSGIQGSYTFCAKAFENILVAARIGFVSVLGIGHLITLHHKAAVATLLHISVIVFSLGMH